MSNDPTVKRISEEYLQLKQGKFRSFVFQDVVEGGIHLALVKGEINPGKVVPVRVHVHRGLLDVVLNPSSPWSWTLETTLEVIAAQEAGVVVILSYNETVDELVGRININTETKFRSADHAHEPENLRMLGAGGQILANLGVRRLLALGRKKKAHGLSGFGLSIVDYVETPADLERWVGIDSD